MHAPRAADAATQRATLGSLQARPRAAWGAGCVGAAAARTSSRARAASCSSLYASTACFSSSFSYASWRSRRWRRAVSRISWSSVGVAERRAACRAARAVRVAAMPWEMYSHVCCPPTRRGCGLRQPAALPPEAASPPLHCRPTLRAHLTARAVRPALHCKPRDRGPCGLPRAAPARAGTAWCAGRRPAGRARPARRAAAARSCG